MRFLASITCQKAHSSHRKFPPEIYQCVIVKIQTRRAIRDPRSGEEISNGPSLLKRWREDWVKRTNRILRAAPNPETQAPPVDLHPGQDHARTVAVEVPSHRPNDKQAGLCTSQKKDTLQG